MSSFGAIDRTAMVPAASGLVQTDQDLTELAALVGHAARFDEVARPGQPCEADEENQLAQARLGIAGALFAALRAKDAATSGHSLRVALACSAWAARIGMPREERDCLEVAALLHDVGKIGVPDAVLLKSGAFDPDEQALMGRHRTMGLEILSMCCANSTVLEIVRFAPAWYDGSRPGFDRAGDELPLGARLLAIIDAFDSMTSDQVYRRATSLERALYELYQCGGKQFDPNLVRQFIELRLADQPQLGLCSGRRWLQELDESSSHRFWSRGSSLHRVQDLVPETLFQQRLLDHLRDAVIFVDRNLQIVLWNPSAERLTGIAGDSVFQRRWQPSLLEMQTLEGNSLVNADCPVARAIAGRTRSHLRYSIKGRGEQRIPVDLHVAAVMDERGTTYGATITMHDASGEASLEERCQNLHEMATRDPLTQVANRAEFDRVHELFVATHLQQNLPCSLIICDIDHFKKINDTYGHPAGDEAIKAFADLLKNACRMGDLVARYGGEEFVVLCADCNNATAASRAEQMRRSVAEMDFPFLGGRAMTASFGVTEIQPGDTAETMLNRADRALLEAKQSGRNTVVQLGVGIDACEKEPKRRWWQWGMPTPSDRLLDRYLLTKVPLKVAVEKLRGFLADHHGEVISLEDNLLKLRIGGGRSDWLRRASDQQVPLAIEMQFAEERLPAMRGEGNVLQTRIHLVMRLQKCRDRRRGEAGQRARQVLQSIKSYLMATETEAPSDSETGPTATNLLTPWRNRHDSQ